MGSLRPPGDLTIDPLLRPYSSQWHNFEKRFVIEHQQWAVVVTQLVEWSLPIPEVHGSNPVICKKLY